MFLTGHPWEETFPRYPFQKGDKGEQANEQAKEQGEGLYIQVKPYRNPTFGLNSFAWNAESPEKSLVMYT